MGGELAALRAHHAARAAILPALGQLQAIGAESQTARSQHDSGQEVAASCAIAVDMKRRGCMCTQAYARRWTFPRPCQQASRHE